MPRIIAGKAKGLKLKSLKGEQTRPSGARLKEAVFSILQPGLMDARFLDLFAGSGQMGLEALSRGAAQAVFAEKNAAAYRVLAENIERSGLGEQAHLYARDARQVLKILAKQENSFDYIYLDPPWQVATRLLSQSFPQIMELLTAKGLVLLEIDGKQVASLDNLGFTPYKTCHYGRAMVLFYKNMNFS